MKTKEWSVGDKAVLNTLADAVVYVVAEVEGFSRRLEYKNDAGDTRDGGWVDKCYLREPSKAQLNQSA